MKKALITIISIVLIAVSVEAGSNLKFYKKVAKKACKIREVWCNDLTAEMLENRGDDIIIEKIIGTVINDRKDGRIMGEDDYNYISYRRVKGAKKGDTVLTICIYNPGNPYCDDICERFDYIIDRRK